MSNPAEPSKGVWLAQVGLLTQMVAWGRARRINSAPRRSAPQPPGVLTGLVVVVNVVEMTGLVVFVNLVKIAVLVVVANAVKMINLVVVVNLEK